MTRRFSRKKFLSCQMAPSSLLTAIWVAMDSGAHHLSAVLVDAPALPSALVALNFPVVAVLVAAGDVHPCESVCTWLVVKYLYPRRAASCCLSAAQTSMPACLRGPVIRPSVGIERLIFGQRTPPRQKEKSFFVSHTHAYAAGCDFIRYDSEV